MYKISALVFLILSLACGWAGSVSGQTQTWPDCTGTALCGCKSPGGSGKTCAVDAAKAATYYICNGAQVTVQCNQTAFFQTCGKLSDGTTVGKEYPAGTPCPIPGNVQSTGGCTWPEGSCKQPPPLPNPGSG